MEEYGGLAVVEKDPYQGRAMKNFKCEARPGTHLFPKVQYIMSKHKKSECRASSSFTP
jgi:hypothetical protein